VKDTGENFVKYEVVGPGGLVTQMIFGVSWIPDASGSRAVTIGHEKFLTTRQTLYFIPIAPKRAPAFASYERFAAALRRELTP
jgi:hypothetical protein